jgi:nanoRNase/pAp phosphatase (c-di-AMP/oligoRNAs hydrolase)
MNKQAIETIHEKNRIVDNIISALQTKQIFLFLGHKNPDEDCIGSMVAFALIVGKFSKRAHVHIGENVHEHFQYLLDICSHNAIGCSASAEVNIADVDAVVVCDTPKPAMIDATPQMEALLANPSILKIEIDHHLGADSQYIGDEGYRLVTEATSSSELVGHIALKLAKRGDLMRRYNINHLLSRNVVLSILTGIVGDTNMGLYIKSRRQKRYYDIFSNLYNTLLVRSTTQETNFTNKDEVFHEIQRLSTGEARCHKFFMDRKRFTGLIGYVVLGSDDMKMLTAEFDNDTIVSVSRSIADHLAEESTRLGLVVYDDSAQSGLVQFRLRRGQDYKTFDLRTVLDLFSIEDGGGHEGAIGFRIEKEKIPDLDGFVAKLVRGIESAMN